MMPETFDPDQYEFHYDKNKRLESQSDWMKTRLQKQSFFKRNRNLLIILFDIMIILVVFLVFLPYANIGKPLLMNYRLAGKAFYFNGVIMVSVVADPQKKAVEAAVTLEFSHTKEIDDEATMLRGIVSPDKENYFRLTMEESNPPDSLYVRVIIGEEKKIIKISLDKE